MPSVPSWALALTFWLHLLAAVTWVGSLVAISLLVLPAATRTLKPVDQLALLDAMQRRLEPVAWFSLSLLVATGLFQMSVNIHYNGFLSTSNQWSLAILIKHGLVVGMIVASAVQTWEVLPAIRRVLMRKDRAGAQELSGLQRRETLLLRVNLILALLILLATAFARAA
jgi:putative copper resistance protein D